jgi:hypothetical protein
MEKFIKNESLDSKEMELVMKNMQSKSGTSSTS